MALGQLLTGDNFPPDENKAQLLPTRTTPYKDNSPLGPLATNKITYQDQYLDSGELSGYALLYVIIEWYIHVEGEYDWSLAVTRQESHTGIIFSQSPFTSIQRM